MIEDKKIHFAADEEQRERFVLRQMNEAEFRAAGEHLAACASCTAAVARERLLAAGVRRFGRDRLRDSLGKTIAETRRSSLPYVRILSAAAVIAIIVGVGFYNNWFKENGEILNRESDGPVLTQETGNETAKESDDAARQRPPLALEEKERTAPPAASRPAGRRADTSPAGKDEGQRMLADKITGTGARSEIAAAAPSVSQPVESTEVYWTEGVPLARTDEPQESGAMKKSLEDYRSGKEAARAKVSRDNAKGDAQVQSKGMGSNYKLNQRPVSALPREQRVKQQNQSQNRVQTRIEQRAGMTEMTLYLDSLIDDREVLRAHVDSVSGDSLVVNMGNQRIGYKLRTGNNTQDQRRGK